MGNGKTLLLLLRKIKIRKNNLFIKINLLFIYMIFILIFPIVIIQLRMYMKI